MYVKIEVFRYEPAHRYELSNGKNDTRFKTLGSLVSPPQTHCFYFPQHLIQLVSFLNRLMPPPTNPSLASQDRNCGTLIASIACRYKDGEQREITLLELEKVISDFIENLSRQRD